MKVVQKRAAQSGRPSHFAPSDNGIEIPTSSGSDAVAQEVMPGETSGEVMLALSRQEAKKRASHLRWPISPSVLFMD